MRLGSKYKQLGFTLVELSIVILISAILTGALLALLKDYQKRISFEKNTRVIENATDNIENFLSHANRYPCPANPALTINDLDYGKEDCTLAPVPGARDANKDGTIDNVLIGVLPVYGVNHSTGENLTLNEKTNSKETVNTNVVDAYGNRLTYAVSESLTKDANPAAAFGNAYDPRLGAIKVVDEFDRDTGGTKDNAHYVVIAHGEDQRGAVLGTNGVQKPCDAATFVSEGENCNGDSTFRQALISEADTSPANYYDDFIGFSYSGVTGIWAKMQDPASGAITDNIYNLNTKNIGIKNPNPQEKLDVAGNIKADAATYQTEICDNNSTSPTCFKPSSIYSLNCPITGTYMKSITTTVVAGRKVLQPNCVTLNLTALPLIPCVGRLQGIYSDGTTVCN